MSVAAILKNYEVRNKPEIIGWGLAMRIISTLSADKLRSIPYVDRSLFESIGELTVNFALLEQILQHSIEILLFPNRNAGQYTDTSAIITCEMSFRRLTELFQCLVRHRCCEADWEICKSLCANMATVEEKRNTIIHSQWATDGTTWNTIRIKTTAKGKGLKRHIQEITKDDIIKIADDIGSLSKRLSDFIELEQDPKSNTSDTDTSG